MSNTHKSSGAPAWLMILIGVVLMLGGTWMSLNWHPSFYETLAHQGIPLDLGHTVAAIGVFLILFKVIQFFFLNPLSEAINTRNTELVSTFSQAEELKNQMQTMRTDYERRLQETEAQAREQIQAQIREAQQLRQNLMTEAAERADALVTEAQARIARERDSILNDLRLQVVDLTLTAAEKVIGENMDDERNRRIVNDFIDKVEVAR